MMRIYMLIMLSVFMLPMLNAQTADEIIERVDKNLTSDNMVMESSMTIHGKRNSRTLTSIAYVQGDEKSFQEYLSPARDKGTKMLKLEDKLWIYSPTTDRTIQIAGHMLRQSMMGSDMSYEDLMEERKLTEMYEARIVATEEFEGREVYVIELKALLDDVAYHSQKLWVDKQRFVPLQQDQFAKSGQLLKRVTLSDVRKIGERWYPHRMVYKDMLKQGDGTEMLISSIKFDQDIPDYMFTKAALKQ
jgi:outer membrane lipoprotein-sorting protein